MKKTQTLWLLSAVVPGMIAGIGQVRTQHLVRANGRITAICEFIRRNPLAHDIGNPIPAK